MFGKGSIWMRRLLIYAGAIVLLAGAIAAIVLAKEHSNQHDDDTSQSTTVPKLAPKKACNVFKLSDAKELLGDTAKGGVNPIYESSNDLDVSTCTYTQDPGENAAVSSRKSATLLVRAPLTNKGKLSNQNEFGPLEPGGVQDVSGYGDNAYWDPQHGQLNILKHDTWYIVSYGPTSPTDRTLDDAKKLADILINKM
jgi:hypothetical protein